jgi:hypothetical protein
MVVENSRAARKLTVCVTQQILRNMNVTNIPKQSVVASDIDVVPSLSDAAASSRWAFINGWKVEPQSDDRAPVFGAVVSSTEPSAPAASPAARRSTARRKHQLMFKEWSRERHD